ncbi:MAG: imelysin family protein [Hydrogenophaga sp.]|jgi:putative iron-regulated protein|uniref:imelysin family protein n=1 Tax=Hydrogenophaga sp. TaxID=1904254 RepID=UPI001D6BBC8B|nr:imelysin family protein [Hydrogenophaga sp.]MBW0169342.1 iron-regulated protein [Hydrogenophaga sp.]MBW0184656.1 iron-regulated protein [Hydrogenophaga sp.]
MQIKNVLAAAVLGLALSAGAQAQTAATPASVATHYAELVHANYSDTLAAAQDMQAAIATFVAAPSAEGLAAARKAWLQAREFYGQTEAFRFYGGPIDDDKGPEGRINAWPLDEAYVDYVQGKPKAGLINNPKFKITKANLAKFNERGGEENISSGWHAVEFLLWGQDLSETGPGNRSFEDYVDGKTPNADRRRQFLTVATALLVDDLTSVNKAWLPGQKNYRARFEKGGKESVRKIIVGLGSLSRGELAGERMEVALNSQDQEDEHSCFSDNTHRDIVTNALGIQNVWLGQYKKRDGSLLQGPSVRDLVAASKADLAEKTSAQLASSLAAAESIPAPFDRAIAKGAPGRPAIEKTIASLVEQSKLLVESASAVGIAKLTLVEP